MSKENKPAPSAKEATQAILQALNKTQAPEAVIIELYLETAFLEHRREQMEEDHEQALELVEKTFKS